MKTLQSNFTTPEQSKRLLDLGLPADSADCYYDQYQILNFRTEFDYGYDFFGLNFRFIPCWSVGSLIEIYEICFGGYFNSRYFGHTLMEDVLLKIEEQIDSIDFSKLEE